MDSKFRKLINIRDLGGYKSADGRSIRHGLLYRSGGLYLMNEPELEYLNSLGIKSILDLRSDAEAEVKPDPAVPGANAMRHSGISFPDGQQIDFSPAGMRLFGDECRAQIRNIHNYYAHMPFDNKALHILMELVTSRSVPLLFHCHTGKDRTGVAAMVLLAALGVPEDTIYDDYLLSNEYHRAGIQAAIDENRLLVDAHPEMLELVHMWGGVTPATADVVFGAIKNRCGSFESYVMQEYDISASSLAELRDFYLE